MKDDTKITVKWNSTTAMYQAKVDYKGKTANFALPDAANDREATNQANKIMANYNERLAISNVEH